MKRLLTFITALFLLVSLNGQILRYSNYVAPTPDLLTNLVAYYKFEEASGTLYDSQNNNDIETVNGPDYRQAGKKDYCLRFIRANSDVCILAQYDDLTMTDQDFTIACWIYQDGDAANGTVEGIIGGLSGAVGFSLVTGDGVTNYERLTCVANSGTTHTRALTNTSGQWNFVAISFDSSSSTGNAHFYYNATSADLSFDYNFDVGKGIRYIGSESGSNYFDGYIDELMIWKGRFLDDDEIATLYNSGKGLFFDDF